ncbi:MAG: phospholipid carrier-dependent glycosyltransferase [Erysipelotrichaceae bacterium]|nr:phospholipid carrier-dependent glycosyltransferase [Erysipelotrichaceae bacterium]
MDKKSTGDNMFKDFSAAYLGNSELISMVFVCTLICLFASWIYTKLPKENKRISRHDSDLPAYCRASKTFRKLSYHDAFWILLLTALYSIISLWNLGSLETIDSYWQPVTDHEEIILELNDSQFDGILWISGEGDNNSNPNGYQNQVDFLIQGSNDLNQWIDLTELNTIDYLKIQMTQGDWDYRYVKLISRNRSNVLNEIGFRRARSNDLVHATIVSVSNESSPYSASALLDEQDFLKMNPSYTDETYFDEIYHTRNAQEIVNHQHLYAFVHPLLGTQLIAMGISMFGLSPFGWRIIGAVFGILMMPLIYICALHLFHKRRSAVFASFLLGIECMHYTTSRIGTLEPFSVFFILLMTYFMLKYTQTSFYDTPLRKQFIWLALSGISMGLACATKFTGVYGGIGLAILFFSNIFERTYEYIKARKRISSRAEEELHFKEREILSIYWPKLIKTGLWCILFFIVVPLMIYALSYLPIVIHKTEGFSLKAVYDQTMGMYNYHKNLDATHPYQSVWWQWILDIRPIWYYVRYNETTMNTISAMGNPILFWCGALSMVWCFIDAFKNKSHPAVLISICYLAQLVPWLAVNRCVFIYHYYPSVPFLIFGIVYACESLLEKDKRYMKPIMFLALIACTVFILFLPVIGGFETTNWYIQHIVRWMGSWYFG